MPYYAFGSSLSLQSNGVDVTGVSVLNFVNGVVVADGDIANVTMPSVSITDGTTTIDNLSGLTVNPGIVLSATQETPQMVTGQFSSTTNSGGLLKLPSAPVTGNYILMLSDGSGTFTINDPETYGVQHTAQTPGFNGDVWSFFGGYYKGGIVPQIETSRSGWIMEIENVQSGSVPQFFDTYLRNTEPVQEGPFTYDGPALDANIYSGIWAFQAFPQNGPFTPYLPLGTENIALIDEENFTMSVQETNDLTNETPVFGATIPAAGIAAPGTLMLALFLGSTGRTAAIST